jgi:short subunit dehydrogenase-like uncharacterized protein
VSAPGRTGAFPAPLSDRSLDVVVYGATGFTGRLVAGYLARNAPAGVRIGLAGRSLDRLAAVRDGLGRSALDWPLLRADSGDPDSLAALAAATRVVATTVGPYATYGMPLVEACARAGTSTCDLAGEVLYVRRCIDGVHQAALRSGARIVNACGFDSIPSDLGVLLAAQRARDEGEGELEATTLVVRSIRGSVSGGTVDSLRGQVDQTRADPALRALVADPYSLSPERAAEPEAAPHRHPVVGRDPELGGWFGPFVMAPFNTRIVRRSNALQGWAYGRRFRYREVQGTGASRLAPAVALGLAAGLGAGVAGLRFGPTRALLDRLLPSPGQGPDERVRSNGHFCLEIHARAESGARYVALVAAQGDPGYAATSVMLGESALCLAMDAPGRSGAPAVSGSLTTLDAGVLTPATAMGTQLVELLRRAGFRMDVIRQHAG